MQGAYKGLREIMRITYAIDIKTVANTGIGVSFRALQTKLLYMHVE